MKVLRKIGSITLVITLVTVVTALRLSSVDNQNGVATGIYLDDLKNEVFLMSNDGPSEYLYSNIFTPVCETGVCKPIYINLYWDMNGNYLRFDFPEGEILTKLDHVPFTEDDYLLLDEILRGVDPRTGIAQANPSQGSSSGENQSSPAPAQSKVLLKLDMVDGVTGSTLPEHKDKFVPGALYTTYTIWDLANTHQLPMMEYTQQLERSRNDED
ncbi:MAG: hypothetical protein ACI865_002373 [Flavobacteriaceae bacterium]|jgi:hypothetical protein